MMIVNSQKDDINNLLDNPTILLSEKYHKANLVNAYKNWKKIISLPFFPDLEQKNINYIINCLKTFDKKLIKKNETI